MGESHYTQAQHYFKHWEKNLSIAKAYNDCTLFTGRNFILLHTYAFTGRSSTGRKYVHMCTFTD